MYEYISTVFIKIKAFEACNKLVIAHWNLKPHLKDWTTVQIRRKELPRNNQRITEKFASFALHYFLIQGDSMVKLK